MNFVIYNKFFGIEFVNLITIEKICQKVYNIIKTS